MKIIVTALLLLVTCFSQGQSRRSKLPDPAFYAFDASWKSTNVDKAVYLLVENKENDSCWRYDTYNILGPLIKTERFTAKDGDVAQGKFVFFNQTGSIDSIQYYKNGLADSKWIYLDAKGKVYREKDYINGILQKTTDHTDTLAEKRMLVKDTFVRVEKESEFDGGQRGWRDFLTKNFRYPPRAVKNGIQGVVIVQFMVDKEGKVENAEIVKSVEYSVDTETLRIMNMSPKWKPAEQDGRVVKSYKKQPITYKLQR